MKIEIKRTKIVLSVMFLVAILLCSYGSFVWGQSSSSKFTISGGQYPGAPSYTVYSDGSTYYAKNQYGAVSWSSTDAAYVINTALSAVGATGKGSVVCVSAITGLMDTITVPLNGALGYSYVDFEFSTLSWDSSFNKDALVIYGYGSGYPTSLGKISGDGVIINTPNYAHAAVKLHDINYATVDVNHIQNQGFIDDATYTRNSDAVGLMLECDGVSTDCSINKVSAENIRGFYTGVLINATGGGAVNDNVISGMQVLYAINSFDMYHDGAGSGIDLNTYENCIADGTHFSFDAGEKGFICGNQLSGGSLTKYIGCIVHDAPANYSAFYTGIASYTDTYKPRLIGCHTSVGFPAIGDFGVESCSGGLVASSLSYAKTINVPTNYAWTTAYTGTGAGSQLPNILALNTGTNASSTAKAYCAVVGLAPAGNIYYVDYRKTLEFSFSIERLNTDSQVTGYFQLKQANTAGDLAAAGLGVYCVNSHWYGEAYGSARQTLDLVVNDNAQHDIRIVLVPSTSVTFYVDGVNIGSITGTGVPSGYVTASHYFVASIANGGTGGVNANIYVSNIVIKQGA